MDVHCLHFLGYFYHQDKNAAHRIRTCKSVTTNGFQDRSLSHPDTQHIFLRCSTRIELAFSDPQSDVLPLHYKRHDIDILDHIGFEPMTIRL